ncbi:MAG: aspartate aminotransferase family protein [Firmicutes bacterium]|nr:aspartate aminotransferase family protein [Bacillota bacterium]
MLTGEIIQLDKKYYMDTFGDRTPIVFTEGKGSTLYDTNGKAYTDFLAGIAVNSLGYNHPKLTEAIINQAGKLLHCSNIFYIEAQAQLAKLLVENSCGNKVFFCNSGAEANEGAIKLVRKYFSKQGMNKYEILSADNSFHGRTLATIAATGQEKYQKPFKPMPVGFKHIPYNNLAAAKEAVTENTAAILIEVIQGEGGVIEGTIEYIQGLQKLCRLKGLLLIVDEVQTGIGRTGKLFGYEHYNIEPDIFTLAKGLGGGVPIGAIVAKGDAAEVFEPGDHGSTFGGNPLACSAGLAVLSTVLEKDFLKSCAEKGNLFKEGLSRLKEKFQFIKDVRGQGLILGMELDEKTSGKVIVKKALNKGFIINCAGHNTLRFVPPLIIQENEIQRLLSTLHEIFLEESLVVK